MNAMIASGVGAGALILILILTIVAKDGKINDLSDDLNDCKAARAISEAVNLSNASEIKEIKADLAETIARNKRLELAARKAVKEAVAEKGELYVQNERLRDRINDLAQTDCSQHPVRDGFVELYNESIGAGSTSESRASGSAGGNYSPGS